MATSSTPKPTLESLAADIERNEGIVALDPQTGDPRTRAGRETRKHVAEQALAQAKEDYTKLLLESTVFIPLEGNEQAQNEYSYIAGIEANTLALDGRALYHRLADEVYPTLSKRDPTFTANQDARLFIALKEVCGELGITSMSQPFIVSGIAIPDKETLVTLIRDGIRKVVGDDLNKMYITKNVADAALKVRYNSSVVPVILTNLTKGEVEALQGEKKTNPDAAWTVIPVKLMETVSAEQVVKSLTAVRNKLKTIKTTKTA